MQDFLTYLTEGNGFSPSDNCINAFNSKFEDAVNVEWFDKKTYYETIFYKDQIEHIAIFSVDGELLEYKMLLPTTLLPEAIKESLEKRGELMNIVLINKGNTIVYEAILRDEKLNRFLLLLTDLGKIIKETSL